MAAKFSKDGAALSYIPINPVSLVCPECGATAGKACQMLKDDVEIVHVARIKAAASADIVARKLRT